MALLLCAPHWDQTSWHNRLQRLAPERDIRVWPDIGDPKEITYAAVWKQPPGLLANLPNLQGILSLGAGVDHIISDPSLPSHIPIARVLDNDLTTRMSEWVVMHALIHLRRQRTYDRQQQDRIWRDIMPAPAACAVRVGVMGLGVLGQDSARKLAMMGFDVAGWSRTPKIINGIETFDARGLDQFLARTDILVVLLPLTQHTKGILNADLFAKLARNGVLGAPILMNAGRGGLQVETDILAALNDGILGAATLDVFETEPLPHTSALWSHPHVSISPHNAAMSDEEAVGRFILREIEQHEKGRSFSAPVDIVCQY